MADIREKNQGFIDGFYDAIERLPHLRLFPDNQKTFLYAYGYYQGYYDGERLR